MPVLELSFASGEDSLSVRRFAVREGISSLFEVSVSARSPNEDIDLEGIVGKPASLRVDSGVKHALGGRRTWAGVCSSMEQEQAEATGLSTYNLRIVPALWLLTHRRNHRVFQHESVPEIVGRVLDEWGIAPVWRMDRGRYAKLEYRVQYGESDFDFLRRLLEEAGISFFFSDEAGEGTALVLSDRPHAGEAREGGPLAYIDNPNEAAEREFVTRVKVAHEVRPGRVTIRDFDFRRKPDYKLVGEASAGSEERYEQHRYEPGSFVVEGHRGGETPAADDRGVARADERAGKASAERSLAGERASRRRVSFSTNALDLRPGVVFSMSRHARSDLAPEKRLLSTELKIEGTHDGEWSIGGQAVFAAQPYVPARSSVKPRVYGVQSAVVVGPRGDAIHTDEFGRVRVQFHWDREGEFDDGSSCWVRVSQGWAGGGFGMMVIPRVGHEVLVGFFEGDPDQPVVVGRVYNNTARVPYKLPEHKTRSTWKSDSSPGSDGFNEIMFEDAAGSELVYVQAERDLTKLVKVDEVITVGRNRTTTVGEVDASAIGVKHSVNIKGTPTGTEIVAGRISLTTGAATITLDGPNVTIDAGAGITLNAGSDTVINASASVTVNGGANVTVNGAANVAVSAGASLTAGGGSGTVVQAGGDLVLQGGPMVKINPGGGGGGGGGGGAGAYVPSFGGLPMAVPPEVDLVANMEDARRRRRSGRKNARWFAEKVCEGGEWDYSRLGPEYEDFAAFHLGVVGRAAGFPAGVLARFSGKRRRERGAVHEDWGDPGNGLWGGKWPYGNELEHCQLINAGCEFYDSQKSFRKLSSAGGKDE